MAKEKPNTLKPDKLISGEASPQKTSMIRKLFFLSNSFTRLLPQAMKN